MSTDQQQTDSSGADKKSFNIRVPQPIALRIQQQALSLGTSPTTLIQSIVVRHFESETRLGEIESATQTAVLMNLEAIRKLCDLIVQTESKRYGQILFESSKHARRFSTPSTRHLAGPPSIRSWTPARRPPASTSPTYRPRRRKVGEHAHSAGSKVASWSYIAPDVGSDGTADARDRRGALGNFCNRARMVLGWPLWRSGRSRVLRPLDTRVDFHPGSSPLVPIAPISRWTLSRREHVRVSEPELLLRALVRDLVRPLLALGVDADRSDSARGGKVSLSVRTRRRR